MSLGAGLYSVIDSNNTRPGQQGPCSEAPGVSADAAAATPGNHCCFMLRQSAATSTRGTHGDAVPSVLHTATLTKQLAGGWLAIIYIHPTSPSSPAAGPAAGAAHPSRQHAVCSPAVAKAAPFSSQSGSTPTGAVHVAPGRCVDPHSM